MGTVGVNGVYGIGYTHDVYWSDHGDAGMTIARKDMGDTWVGISVGSGSNAVSNELHKETTGSRHTVGSVAANIQRVHRRERLRRGWFLEGRMVAARGGT